MSFLGKGGIFCKVRGNRLIHLTTVYSSQTNSPQTYTRHKLVTSAKSFHCFKRLIKTAKLYRILKIQSKEFCFHISNSFFFSFENQIQKSYFFLFWSDQKLTTIIF